MTMLDRMRRHKGWLKWSLALVVVAFIIFYIPDFLGTDNSGQSTTQSDEVARVNDQGITVAEFTQAYQNQLQAYRSAYGQDVNEQLLRQLGFDRQVLQQLIDQEALMFEANRLGISVTDAEVRQRILAMPSFQENGQFIGEQKYRQILDMQQPPMTPAQFEASLRQQMVMEKLRAVVTDWITVTDAEVNAEYRRRNEKVKVDLVHFSSEAFRGQATASDAETTAHFEANKEQYRVGEQRKIRYLLIDGEAMLNDIAVAPRDVERYYNDNIDQYTTPEQVRASHILFRTEGKDETAVRAAAEQVMAEAKKGADFAELARKYSEDEATKEVGGDLDYFPRGAVETPFEDAAFSLEPGSVGDLVKTSFGLHIVKVIDRKAAVTRTLDEVRAAVTEQLKEERAQRQMTALASEIGKTLKTPADLDKAAAARGWKVEESAYFTREDSILGLSGSTQLVAQAFELTEAEVTPAISVTRGLVFAALAGKQPASIPVLDAVKERVRDDVVKTKASKLAQEKAMALAPALKNAKDFANAAKKAGVKVETSDLVTRDMTLPSVGLNQTVETTMFALPVGVVSDPITTLDGTTIVRVIERKDVTPDELKAAADSLRAEMLDERRTEFLTSYMAKAKQKMTIVMNPETLQRVTGS